MVSQQRHTSTTSPYNTDLGKSKQGLHSSRVTQQKKKAHNKQLSENIKYNRAIIYNKHKGAGKSENDTKKNLHQLQKIASNLVEDDELQSISDGVGKVFKSSKMALPVNIAKLALDSRAALKDYSSKWWILAFFLAIVKDGLLDFFVLPGYILSIYFFFFLFGGGFVKKYLRKKMAILILLFIIGLIPGLNAFIPETVLAVFLRWRGSKKAADKARKNLEQIKEKYSQYDTQESES